MNKLKVGRYKLDISEISHAREVKAQGKWQRVFENTKKIRSARFYNKHTNKIGSYLLNQDMFILRRTLSFSDALKELLKRRLIITSMFLNRLCNTEYEGFQNFVYLTISGKTLKQLEQEKEDSIKKKDLASVGIQAMKNIEKMGLSVDQCSELFQTWLKEQVKSENILVLTQENK